MSEEKQARFGPEQIELIRKVMAPGIDDVSLRYVLQVFDRLGLDPFARQVYAMKRRERGDDGEWREKWAVQVSIDGFRLVAERTGQYEGQVGPWWCGPDAQWKEVWLETGPPAAAKIGVLRKGFREPLYAVARFDAYCQRARDGSPGRLWRSLGDTMIAKVAESLALRRAFPAELSGVYTNEEMGQAQPEQAVMSEAETELAAEQARVRKESSEAAEALIGLAEQCRKPDDLARFCHFNGFEASRLHANAKAKLWRRLLTIAEGVGVQQAEMRKWLNEAQEMPAEEDAPQASSGEGDEP